MPAADRGERDMSDQEQEITPTGQVGSSDAGSYSSNGTEPGGIDLAGESIAASGADDGTAFLADLARAMQSTAMAEQARITEGTEQRRQAHIEGIHAREAAEAEDLRELAKEDVKAIDDWSDGEIRRVKLERERRIASRREALQVRLEEHRLVIAGEVEAVEAAIAAYRTETDAFFSRLGSESDPVEIARQAGSRPSFPVLELIGFEDVPAISTYGSPATQTEPLEASASLEGDGSRDADGPASPSGADSGTADSGTADSGTADSGTADSETTEGSAEDPVAADAGAATLVGVMAPEATATPAPAHWEAAPWQAGSEPAADAPATPAEQPTIEEEKPVEAVAEARPVMARSSGAASWLRWPNSPSDRIGSDK
jgi:hypothetical protein